ncbi:MAG: stage III sporulation protein AA [Faecalibacterium sp.]
MDEFYSVVQKLPSWLALPLAKMSSQAAQQIHELRFKVGAPPMATSAGAQIAINSLLVHKGFAMSATGGTALTVPLTQGQVEHIFFHLCGGSVHSYEDELGQGFFTLAGGHRVGVGGKYIPVATKKDGCAAQVQWQLQQVSSLNVRIARHKIMPLPSELASLLATRFVGLVVLGEPDSGKTTLLRNLVAYLLQQKRTVVVLDEREELAISGVDTLSGMEKSMAVQLALRTLSPEVIVLDELGTLDELVALEQGFFGGVDFIATLHAGTFAEAERKPQFQYLQSHGMLHAACLLQGRHAPGQVQVVKRYERGCAVRESESIFPHISDV